MILPIKYINGKSPKQSSSGRFFIGSVPNTGRSVKIFMINFCIGTFLKLPASGGFPQTGFVLSLSFLLPNILVWNAFYGRFAEFFRLQRTLILYPRNIPEFVLS